ncbi:transcriptional regulator [Methanocaldococcus villosus]|uniref:transcriptional regulator n=1 Tax=Methanocaldococcus villosus TaxID=667126 RepID=UPI000A8139BA|nr:transcriptional regulator [Methanocaldococcus villosus]
MRLIKYFPEEFKNGLYLIPTDKDNISEENKILIGDSVIIKVFSTPNVKKTLSKILYIIKDKYYLFKDINKAVWLKNFLNYVNKKIYFDNYYRAKKAWFRLIKDLFKDLEKDFNRFMGKFINILKVLNPILVFGLHDIRKWNYKKGFINFIKYLRKHNISIVLRYPLEAHGLIKSLFPEAILNVDVAIRYFAKIHGYYISKKVARYLLEITNGNLEMVYIILKHSKREIRNLRELKIPWLKILHI